MKKISNICCKTYCLLLILSANNFYSQFIGHLQNNSVKVVENNDTLLNPWTGGMNSVQISTVDLNSDQIEDLFVFDRTGNKVLTFINNAENFIYAPEYEKYFPSSLEDWVLLRDFNGDNKKDIFSSVSGGIGVWKNTSNNDNLTFEKIEFWYEQLNDNVPYILSNFLEIDSTIDPVNEEVSIDSNYYKSNIYVTNVDIPDINDIDNDGDLDVLTFGIIGTRLEYHKNMSIELGYQRDSLIFELKNDCWGHFKEAGLSNTCILFDTCNSIVNEPEKMHESSQKQSRHSGSTVLSLDLNGDQVRDVILGDLSFTNLVALYNDNAGANMNTSIVNQDTTFPSNSVPANIYMFPAVFYEDLNNDGVNDLIVSPNSENETMNKESIWYYENAGTNNQPLFYLQKKNILQETTIDLGSGSKPILVDINSDSIDDLLVANFGEFDIEIPIHYKSSIKSYINTGTNDSPLYIKSSDNFQNISTLINEIDLYPTFGDLDNDGDLDMVIGDFSGKIHYFQNNPLDNGSMNLSLIHSPMSDQFENVFDFGNSSHPVLFDVDYDGDLDLIVGEEKGNLNFIENIGTISNFNFELVSEEFGAVDVSQWWTNIGSSTPIFTLENNEIQLYVGSERGAIFKYSNIENNLNGEFELVDSLYSNINTGPNSSIAFFEINNDSLLDIIVGNKRGGLTLFTSVIDSNVTNLRYFNEKEIKIFPNPVSDKICVNNYQNTYYSIYNIAGQVVKTSFSRNIIRSDDLDSGIYFLKFVIENKNYVLKFIK